MEKVIELVKQFRTAIDKAYQNRDFDLDQRFSNFPHGCCGITTDLLAKFLLDNGYDEDLFYVSGTYEDVSHAWLETQNCIIDITGDQFKHSLEFKNYNIPVYIGQDNGFFSLFENIEWEKYSKDFVLGDNNYHFLLSRKKLYDIILKYI